MILSVNLLDILNGWYGYYKSVFGKRVFCPVGREFFLDNVECGFESEKVYLMLSTEYGDKIVSHMLPRDELTPQGMTVLSGKGFDVKHWELVQGIISLLEEEYFENNSMKSFHFIRVSVGIKLGQNIKKSFFLQKTDMFIKDTAI